jgi:hypothetical protein
MPQNARPALCSRREQAVRIASRSYGLKTPAYGIYTPEDDGEFGHTHETCFSLVLLPWSRWTHANAVPVPRDAIVSYCSPHALAVLDLGWQML